MANAAARAVILELQRAGYSLASIGEALERDSSMLSQIARDSRRGNYGAQLAAPLEALAKRLRTDSGGLVPASQAQHAIRSLAGSRETAAPRRRVKDTRAGAPADATRLAPVRRGVRAAGKASARLPGAYTAGSGGAKSNAGLASLFASSDATGQRIYLAVTLKDGRKVGLGEARTADQWRALGVRPDGGGTGSLGSQLAGAAVETVYELDDEVDDWSAGLIAED